MARANAVAGLALVLLMIRRHTSTKQLENFEKQCVLLTGARGHIACVVSHSKVEGRERDVDLRFCLIGAEVRMPSIWGVHSFWCI